MCLISCHSNNPSKIGGNAILEQHNNCIETALSLDDQAGRIRNHACESTSLSQAILNYTQSLEQIDFSSCPKDFKAAFEGHIRAWQAAMEITDKYPNLRGEMHDLFKRIEEGQDGEKFKSKVKAIWDTWAEIEKANKK